MKITDTYSELMSLFDRMNGEFDMGLWSAYIAEISDGLCEKLKKDSSSYDFNRDILPVIKHAMHERGKIEMAHNSFLLAVHDLDSRVRKVAGIQLDVNIVFYLGLCNGAGWATTLNGKPIVLLGVEKVVELDWCDAKTITSLIHHELGHIWHDTVGRLKQDANSIRDKYVMQLYQEGIAMYFEQLIAGDSTQYHQGKGNWLTWCYANRCELNGEYLRRLQANESAQEFFGDWNNYQGFSDVGYFIGCEFVKHLAKKYLSHELANLDISTVYEEFTNYVA